MSATTSPGAARRRRRDPAPARVALREALDGEHQFCPRISSSKRRIQPASFSLGAAGSISIGSKRTARMPVDELRAVEIGPDGDAAVLASEDRERIEGVHELVEVGAPPASPPGPFTSAMASMITGTGSSSPAGRKWYPFGRAGRRSR